MTGYIRWRWFEARGLRFLQAYARLIAEDHYAQSRLIGLLIEGGFGASA